MLEASEGRARRLEEQVVTLQQKVAEYESAIGWSLSCTNCARLMDQNYEQYAKIEKTREALTELAAEL